MYMNDCGIQIMLTIEIAEEVLVLYPEDPYVLALC